MGNLGLSFQIPWIWMEEEEVKKSVELQCLFYQKKVNSWWLDYATHKALNNNRITATTLLSYAFPASKTILHLANT